VGKGVGILQILEEMGQNRTREGAFADKNAHSSR